MTDRRITRSYKRALERAEKASRPLTHNEKVLALLSDGQPHSHRELYGLYVMGHSRVADLRKQGHDIRCWREGDLYMYRLLGGAEGNHAGDKQPASGSHETLRSSEQAIHSPQGPLPRVACSPIQLELTVAA